MNTLNTILLGTLIAATVACGYGSKNYGTTPSNMPAISLLNPNSTTAGDPTFTLAVNGSNFASKATVNWNGTAQVTSYVSTGQLIISVPASAVAVSGSVKITVTNPATSGGAYGSQPAQTSTAMTFTIN